MTALVKTLGCRLNLQESAVMDAHLRAVGATDTVVINTCAVTSEAERQARQAIRRARRDHPSARIVVTGCAAQISPDRYAGMPEVDAVVSNTDKLSVSTWTDLIGDAGAGLGVTDPVAFLPDARAATHDDRARAIIQVQNGCDHRCTFCIIPYGRGPSRSLPLGVIVRQVQEAMARGCKEVVLSGVDITSYGGDLPGRPGLGQMVRRLLALVPDLPRLRLSSLDPAEIDADLWRLIAEDDRLMPHLHLSVQAGDDMILKRMKRRHRRDDVVAVSARARRLRPDIRFGADLIAGFPTETEAMFENTLRLVDDADLTYLHVFPYSERDGTPAARMPAVPVPVRKDRAARLRSAGQRAVLAHLDRSVGHSMPVLMETPRLGRAADFTSVAVVATGTDGEDGPASVPPGTLITVQAIGHDGERLTARPAAVQAAGT